MKTFVAFLFICCPAMAADTNTILVVTSSGTNAAGQITITEAFIQDGQTNLLRTTTKTAVGTTQMRVHRFYHAGSAAGSFVSWSNGGSTFISAHSSRYSTQLGFDRSYQVSGAAVTENNYVLDAYTFTNGLFYHVDAARIKEYNKAIEIWR